MYPKRDGFSLEWNPLFGLGTKKVPRLKSKMPGQTGVKSLVECAGSHDFLGAQMEGLQRLAMLGAWD